MLKHELENFWTPFFEEIELIVKDSKGNITPIDELEYHLENDGTGKIALILPANVEIILKKEEEIFETNEKDSHFDAWVDGACLGNPGPGGWAYVVHGPDGNYYRKYGSISDTVTNNQMELIAAMKAIEACITLSKTMNISHDKISIHIFTDSEYAVDLMIGRTKAKANQALVNALKNASNMFSVKWGWLGRNSCEPLACCDKYAKQAAEAAKEGRTSQC
jgi:ribonuclease HI